MWFHSVLTVNLFSKCYYQSRFILRKLAQRGFTEQGLALGHVVGKIRSWASSQSWSDASKAHILFFFFFLRFYLFIFSIRGRGGEREGEKHECDREKSVAPRMPPTRDLAHNSGMCPNW